MIATAMEIKSSIRIRERISRDSFRFLVQTLYATQIRGLIYLRRLKREVEISRCKKSKREFRISFDFASA